MSQLQEVHQLIDSLRREGELQSRGKFTIDTQRSLVKISQQQQGDPSGWVYWWVRTAVKLESYWGQFQVGRDLIIGQFALAPNHPSLNRLRSFLDGHEESDDDHLGHLRTTLLWLQATLSQEPALQGSLVLEEPGMPLRIMTITGPSLDLSSRATLGVYPRVTLALQTREPGLVPPQMTRLRTKLAQEFPMRLAYCPIPIVWDGRPVNAGLPQDISTLHYLRYYLPPTGAGPLLATGSPQMFPAIHYQLRDQRFWRPPLTRPNPITSVFSLAGEIGPAACWSSSGKETVLSWSQGQDCFRLAVDGCEVRKVDWQIGGQPPWLLRALLYRVAKGEDRWCAVNYGVCLDWEELPLADTPQDLGWRALIAVNSALTDLSGLKLVRSPAVQQWIGWLRGEIADIHEQEKQARKI